LDDRIGILMLGEQFSRHFVLIGAQLLVDLSTKSAAE
jgi:hypothetical protein